jgi:hypothetical protein
MKSVRRDGRSDGARKADGNGLTASALGIVPGRTCNSLDGTNRAMFVPRVGRDGVVKERVLLVKVRTTVPRKLGAKRARDEGSLAVGFGGEPRYY